MITFPLNMKIDAIKMKGLKLAEGMCKICERSNERGIYVSGWFGLLEIRSLIWKSIILIRPSNHRTDENIRVGGIGMHGGEARGAVDLRRMLCNRR